MKVNAVPGNHKHPFNAPYLLHRHKSGKELLFKKSLMVIREKIAISY